MSSVIFNVTLRFQLHHLLGQTRVAPTGLEHTVREAEPLTSIQPALSVSASTQHKDLISWFWNSEPARSTPSLSGNFGSKNFSEKALSSPYLSIFSWSHPRSASKGGRVSGLNEYDHSFGPVLASGSTKVISEHRRMASELQSKMSSCATRCIEQHVDCYSR